MPLRHLKFCAFALLANVIVAAPSFAETPAVKLLTAPLVSPSSAWSFYGSSTTHTTGAAAWTTTPPQIKALARSLGAGRYSNDQYAQNVFDYVRNNIDTEFRFGLAKGGLGALIDQSGTPFDQAELMVKLLREGGLTAGYQVGTITLDATQFGKWTGLIKNLNQSAQTFSVSAKAACQLIADGGIPGAVNSASDCTSLSGDLSSITLGHIWVSANGKLYDPAFKQHTFKAGIDIPAAMGCGTAASPTCGSSIVSAALTGATQGTFAGVPYIQNVSESSVSAQLNAFAVSFENYVKATNRTALLSDLIGGQERDLAFQPVAAVTLPYAASSTVTWSGDIPDQYRSSIRIQFANLDVQLFGDELAGRRVRYFFDSRDTTNKIRSLYADSTLLQSAPCPTCDPCIRLLSPPACTYTPQDAILTVNHPYSANGGTYADDVNTQYVVDESSAFTIFAFWGDASDSTVKAYSDLQLASPSPFDTDVVRSPAMGHDDQPLYAAQFAAQKTALAKLATQLGGDYSIRHHDIGVIQTQRQNYAGPGPISSRSSVSLPSSSGPDAGLATIAAVSAVAEGLIFREAGLPWEHISAPTAMVLSNRKSVRLLSVNSAQMAGVIPQLVNYNLANRVDRRSYLQAGADDGYSYILPQDGYPGAFAVTNGTMYLYSGGDYAFKSGAHAFLLEDTLKGGSSGPTISPLAEAVESAKQSDYALRKHTPYEIGLADGSLLLSPEADLITGGGEFPRSLPLRRFYNSNSGVHQFSTSFRRPDPVQGNLQDRVTMYYGPGSLGGGWASNYDITATVGTNVPVALGSESGVDAAAAIAGIISLRDAFTLATFQSRVAAIFSSYWLGNQLLDSTVTVSAPPSITVFQRLPSGEFNLPKNDAHLEQVGSRSGPSFPDSPLLGGLGFDYSAVSFRLFLNDGSEMKFFKNNVAGSSDWGLRSYKFKIQTWSFPGNLQLTFNETGLSNSLGRSLTFQRVSDTSTSVTDDNGRSVSFNRSGCPDPTVHSYNPVYMACQVLDVVHTDGAISRYEYEPSAASPNPSVLVRPPYRLRRWFTPSSLSEPYLTFIYDDALRISSVKDALARQTQYFAGGIGGEWSTSADVIDGVGSLSTTVFDFRHNPLSSVDALGRVTTHLYDALGRRIKTTLPEGNATVLSYDVRSNVVEARTLAKPGSGLADTVSTTSFAEGPSTFVCVNHLTCNKPTSENGPRTDVVDVTDYSWDATYGDLLQIKKPADQSGQRPQTDLTYSMFGPGGSQFRLLTGTTDKISSSESVSTAYTYNTSNKYVLSTATVDSGGLNLRTCFKFDAVGNLISTSDARASTCP